MPTDHAKLAETMKRLDTERVAAGLCRHCGGEVPCWSSFGDAKPGVRHDARSFRAASQQRAAERIR